MKEPPLAIEEEEIATKQKTKEMQRYESRGENENNIVEALMVTDLELANACAEIYSDTPEGFNNLWIIQQVVVAHRRIGTDDIVVFRGSKTPHDWFDDFRALPIERSDIGHVSEGFSQGLDAVLSAVLPALGPSVYVTGHSLGGARAWIFGALLISVDAIPRAIVGIAPPKPGWDDLRQKLIRSGAALRAYANSGDPVPDVPLYIPGLAPYVHPITPIVITEPPDDGDEEPLARHHIALYQRGIGRLNL